MAQPIAEDVPREALERVGRTLRGKWRLDALLDVGGMAAVYSATHRNGSRGAIKIMHRDRSAVPEIARRFLREGYIANAVGHPGVVRVLDDDLDDDGNVYMVMELLDGVPLHARAERAGGRLSPREVILVADQVLSVLAAAHDRGILHRDIKPENLFFTRAGEVKVLDFGIAKLPARGCTTTTQSGAPLGTPAFMPPEQASGRFDLVGPRSDVWALGATMFTLLTGAIVHQGETAQELVLASFSRSARPLASVLSKVHPALAGVVDRALARDPADRWTDARAMRAALRRAHAAMFGCELPAGPGEAGPVSGTTRVVRPSTRPSRRGEPRDWALAVAAAVVSFVGVVVVGGMFVG